jgi:hypothetical protein
MADSVAVSREMPDSVGISSFFFSLWRFKTDVNS